MNGFVLNCWLQWKRVSAWSMQYCSMWYWMKHIC